MTREVSPRPVWRKTVVCSTVVTVDPRIDALCTLTMGTPCRTTTVEMRLCGGAQACQVCRVSPSAATTWPLSSSIQYSAPDGNFSKALRTDAACSTVAYHVPSLGTVSTLPCSRRRRRNRIACSFLRAVAPRPGTPATPTPAARSSRGSSKGRTRHSISGGRASSLSRAVSRAAASCRTGAACGRRASAIWCWNDAEPCTMSGCA